MGTVHCSEEFAKYTLASKTLKYENGNLYWIGRRRGAVKNRPAGYVNPVGYRTVYVGRRVMMAHRIIWFMFNGLIPEGLQIDHKNCNKDDNSIENLRICTRGQNRSNTKIPSTNTTGFKGVHINNGRGKPFTAQVKCKGKRYHLGHFDTAEEAKAVYDEKAKELHGEFYRYE